MREKLLKMKLEAENDFLYAKAKIEVCTALLEDFKEEEPEVVVAEVPVDDIELEEV